MNVSMIPVKLEEKLILRNLFSLYLHDLSEFTDHLDSPYESEVPVAEINNQV